MDYRITMADEFAFAELQSGHEGWIGYKWELTGDGCLVYGCVPNGVYKRGPKKGRPNISHPMPMTSKWVIVRHAELQKHAAFFEDTTGRCWDCKGLGLILTVPCRDNPQFEDCDRCSGRGTPDKTETPCT